MRDARGAVTFTESVVVRKLREPLSEDDFLRTALARELVEEGKLVPFEIGEPDELRSPRLPFVSYPTEWPDSQLRDAALLTLEISQRAASVGHELRDCSAWNVIFDGARPVFCDHLSFAPIQSGHWAAFGQFLRHFIYPLAVARATHLPAANAFRMYRDGLTTEAADAILGLRRFRGRMWTLSVTTLLSGFVGDRQAPARPGSMHAQLVAYLGWLLPPATTRRDAWTAYTSERDHYGAEAVAQKARQVAAWMRHLAPAWVIDFGANTGEFAHAAADAGAKVIAIDSSAASLDTLRATQAPGRRVWTVLANLGDVDGGRGWAGREFPGLGERLPRADALLVLGLIHHLAVSEAIPLDGIARFVRAHTTRYAVVEFIEADDPMLRALCDRFGREPAEFAAERQRSAFAAYFETRDVVQLCGARRELALLECR